MRYPVAIVIEEQDAIRDFVAAQFPKRSWVLASVREREELRQLLGEAHPQVVVVSWLPRFYPVCAWLLEHRPEIPVIVLAQGWSAQQELCLRDLGAVACLAWPRQRDLLRAFVSTALESSVALLPLEVP